MLPILKKFAGDPTKKTLREYLPIAEAVNQLESRFEALSDDELRAQTDVFRRRLGEGAALDDLLPEAFAAVREAAKRNVGLRHYDVQIIGGVVLHQGKIAEMRTGEGKTLVASLPLYLNALSGKGTHLVTVNDYLARRDARWMGPIFHALGMTVGVLQEAARTDNARKAFLVDPSRTEGDDFTQYLRTVDRAECYRADVVYGTNNEFGFDYLRDHSAISLEARVQRGLYYAIVDEVDNILIDEARTPLILSGPSPEDPALYYRLAQVVKGLKRDEHFEVDERGRSLALTEAGYEAVEKLLGQSLRDPDNPEDLTPEQAKLLSHLEQALRAQFIFQKNKDYLVQAGRVVIVDEFTGRMMPGRRWSDGLHQAVEAKEGLKVQQDNVTYATITLQNYFRLYEKLAGMSGTAVTEAEEFNTIYKLDVVAIPTHLEYVASRPESGLVEVEGRTDGVKHKYYARPGEPDRPVYYKRLDYPDMVFRTEEAKLRAVAEDVLRRYALGQPVLIGTTSVELSERVSARLKPEPLRKLATVLLLRRAYFEAHPDYEDGRLIPEILPLYAPLEKLSAPDFRTLAKSLQVNADPQIEENRKRLADYLDLAEAAIPRLQAALQSGVPHNVLNAKKHDEESRVIARAGELGAVTIATNMAGRGVDIKLGGELAESVINNVNRILRRAGHADPYDMSVTERAEALRALDPAQWGIYEAEARAYLNYVENMQKVRELGGLHVTGSERHEARRIDNQLRGRAARQGDPGSSQFYLSLEDELMRRFGGAGVSDLMQRLKIDDALPIAHGIVSKTIEQSQSRVEGYNFDVRKHLLEYDDVLNTQRNKIYEQRDRIFTKDDLSDDIDEMLVAEVEQRAAAAAGDAEGPWKLLAWLEETQPTILDGEVFYPSYTVRLLLDELEGAASDPAQVRAALLDLAREALAAEQEHFVSMAETTLSRAAERAVSLAKDRRERVETYLEGREMQARESGRLLDVHAFLKEASAVVGVNLPADPRARELTGWDTRLLKNWLGEAAEAGAEMHALSQALVSIVRRTGVEFNLPQVPAGEVDWDAVVDEVVAAIVQAREVRAERLLGEVERDLREKVREGDSPSRAQIGQWLIEMAWGRQTVIDRKTHRPMQVRTQRFPLVFVAAARLADWEAADLAEAVLEHLRGAQAAQQRVWGESEMRRVATQPMRALDADTRSGLRRTLGEADFERLAETPIGALLAEDRERVRDELGRQLVHSLHRQLMASISGQLWVDYLTAMEGLRTSIGLEAYAQRDPLTTYKSRAFDMFRDLLVNMRAGVVSRLFTFRPRDMTRLRAEVDRGAAVGETFQDVGRNDPCPCGSGKKFKHCHGRADGSNGAEPHADEAEAEALATGEPAGAPVSKSARRRRSRKR